MRKENDPENGNHANQKPQNCTLEKFNSNKLLVFCVRAAPAVAQALADPSGLSALLLLVQLPGIAVGLKKRPKLTVGCWLRGTLHLGGSLFYLLGG